MTHDSLHRAVQDGPAVLQEEVAGARRPAELHQQLHGPPRRPRPGLGRLVRRQLGLHGKFEKFVKSAVVLHVTHDTSLRLSRTYEHFD